MAYDLDGVLTSKRMRDLLRITLGNAKGDAGLAIHGTNKANVLTANAIDVSMPWGQFKSMSAQSEIDLSAKTAGGEIIAAGKKGVVLITFNGTSVDAVMCEDQKRTTRASVTSSLVYESGNKVYVPADLDMSSLVVVGFVNIVNDTTANFVVGTTALDTANITDEYYDVSNVFPGVKLT